MTVTTPQNFLIQLYFVLATLIALILIVIGSVNGAQLILKNVLGVKPYPSFSAPYPSDFKLRGVAEPVLTGEEVATAEQQRKIAEWEALYDQWQQEQRQYNEADQTMRRELATALAMLVVGVPVFALHAPYVFKRKS